MDLHKLLARQLGKAELSENDYPVNLNQWHEFLTRINCTYQELDQERYLLERSMDISSREMKELNEKLEAAQQIARLGYWQHDISTGTNIWSKELYIMFGLDFSKPAPDLKTILELTHKKNREHLKSLIDNAFKNNESYETEIRMHGIKDKKEYRWYHIIAHPVIKEGMPTVQLRGVAIDITRRKLIEAEIELLQQKLLASARRAGMADVATSILHNVGNVLNSVNVSAHLINEKINQDYFDNFINISKMLKENMADIEKYLTHDEKGKLIPEYLILIAEKLKDVQSCISEEINNLNHHIRHIKDITAMQKSISGVYELVEKINLAELIEDALKICKQDLTANHIEVVNNVSPSIDVVTDKSKLLQILINLVQNAKDALIAHEANQHKKIMLFSKIISDTIQIGVEDNGEGISAENISKIFTLGFTTKEHGHGFGLHSSAIAAKELKGKLEVKSDGYLKGTLFLLSLPLTREVQHEDKVEQ